jgi:hypothetical protein
MFNVAYGLGCDSKDDPTLLRMERLVTAVTQATLPPSFLVVSTLFRCVHEKNFECANVLECDPSFEAPSFVDAWWLVQEVG